jgi:hypothetical protein
VPKRYAIHIEEDNLDLIQVLNGGIKVCIVSESTYYVLDAVPPVTTTNHKIVSEDDLYDKNGHLKDVNLVLL